MSFESYQEFVYGATLRDWESLGDEMERMKTILDEGNEVRLETTETDLVMSIAGRSAVNSPASVAYDSHNLPSGEVFTAPYDVEGTVYFDIPVIYHGKQIQDVHLTFENGGVVDWSATRNEDALTDIITTDDGSRRPGELGIGMNRGIDRYTGNVLFDEKMAGTVHFALGRAYDVCLSAGEAGNMSAVHVDLITDMRTNSRLTVDGVAVQRNGTFHWEADFEM